MNVKRSTLLPPPLAFSGAALIQPAEFPTPIRGTTLESTDNLDITLKLIKFSWKRLTARLVTDDDDIPIYKKVVDALTSHANVTVQILNSGQVPNYSVGKIRRRTTRATSAPDDRVALWEIGNGLNGNWVGSSPQEINVKAQATYEVIKKCNGRTVLALNYRPSPNCRGRSWETTSRYAESLSASLRNINYAFLSICEAICAPARHPSSNDLTRTFSHFKGQFGKATRFDIGEISTQGESDEQEPTILGEKKRIASYHYGLQQLLHAKMGDRYIGGYFWWYFHRDATLLEMNGGRKDNLWSALKGLFEQL